MPIVWYDGSLCVQAVGQAVQQAEQVINDPKAFFGGPRLEDALRDYLAEAAQDVDAPQCQTFKKRKRGKTNRCAAALRQVVNLFCCILLLPQHSCNGS